jgi:transcriptional regulator with XRE-family HTH domain
MEELTQAQRDRLKAAREATGLTLKQAAEKAGASFRDMEDIEEYGKMIPAIFAKLCLETYDASMHAILHGPYSYTVKDAWIAGYLNGEITEGILAEGLGTDIIDARRQVRMYQTNLN